MDLKALDVCYNAIEIFLFLVPIFILKCNVEVGRMPKMSK